MTVTILAAKHDTVAWQESPGRLTELLGSGDHVLWVDLESPTAEESEMLSRVFKFHPLAIEDAVAQLNHPKVDDYGDYLYVVVHGVSKADKRGELRTAEIDCFLGRRCVVTVHDVALGNVDETRKRCMQVSGLMGKGADWLLHALLDRLADTYLEIIEKLDEEVDGLERNLFRASPPSHRVLAEIFALKRDVLHLKRVVHPARDVYSRIARGEYAVVRAEVAPHFRDVYDHIVRVAEMLENFRDVMGSAVETYLSVMSQRTNQIMKVLTIVSVIMMTTSLLAGIYGMNFDVLPGKAAKWGFWGMIALMAAISGALLAVFRLRRWI